MLEKKSAIEDAAHYSHNKSKQQVLRLLFEGFEDFLCVWSSTLCRWRGGEATAGTDIGVLPADHFPGLDFCAVSWKLWVAKCVDANTLDYEAFGN